ncbi:glycolipid transfer protein [Cylindrobasidium torrendii FP15055 ss-10]|uniref:Glycolipid transfer protein n=1 Tax=Cylindrobasidium torrendii FP15055 ss-10 TaxID=1314674 RepID=A0A0D7BEV3_9AGAR|nr:glycolipid transfer protein [Cylindrobasidium torrendii FP15055 ss-10]
MEKPYFETVKSFADVPVDIDGDGILTADFLEASDGLVGMFDLLGSAIFGFVQMDLKNNIRDVRAHYQSSTDRHNTVQAMVPGWQGKGALVRLVRGLSFTCVALQNAQNDRTKELHYCFKGSYDTVLRHHHSFMIRSVVYVALRAVPYRKDFYDKIAQGAPHDKLDADLRLWLDGLDTIVTRLSRFLKDGGHGTV